MTNKSVPQHVAIVMDGNGRWAERQGLPRLEGHRRGATTARKVVEWAADCGVRQISLFAFSTENWQRPKLEVRGLMSLLASLLPTQVADMNKQGVRVRTLGDIDALPTKARKAVEAACMDTSNNDRIDLILCLNYGGRQEILEGIKRIVRQIQESDEHTSLEALDDASFRKLLWCGDLMPVDLLIRTGGEQRISNFYLWDAAYSELYFTDKYWPEFNRDDFLAAMADFASRERRFGLL